MSRDEHPTRTTRTGTRVVVAARETDAQPDTTEIRGLARAAGHEVVGEVTQQRAADPTYGLGRGKAEALMRRVADRDADAVVYDGELTPGQTFSLGELLPPGTDVIDRTRLVLDLFAEGASSRVATLQVELARLRYEKPRLAEGIARDVADETRFHDEGDKRVLDVERRIDSIRRELAEISDDRAARREQRRAAGFDLVAIAGYTNAGKSTLLNRLADDLELDSAAGESNATTARPTDDTDSDTADGSGVETDAGTDPDIESTVTVANRLFETLDTTTRRATVDGRRLLVTDTVGFVDELPHRSVESFAATLDSVRNADVVLLVVDATDDPSAFRRKLRTSLDAIDDPDGAIVPVLNKVDRVERTAIERRAEAVTELRSSPSGDDGRGDDGGDRSGTPSRASLGALRDPVPVSAIEGDGVDALTEALVDELPTARTTLNLPNSGATQSVLAWAYDRGDVEAVDYEGDRVRIAFAGAPSVVDALERKATGVEE